MVIVSLAVSLMIANLLLPIVGYYSVSYQDTTGGLLRAGGIVLTTNQIRSDGDRLSRGLADDREPAAADRRLLQRLLSGHHGWSPPCGWHRPHHQPDPIGW